MVESIIRDATSTLTATTPSLDELTTLYQELREGTDASNEELVARYALAEVVSEIIDYLELVRDEFEKSIGLTVVDERKRVFSQLSGPTSGQPVKQVAIIVDRWNSFEQVRSADIERATS